MVQDKPRIVVLAGPTASGKTTRGVELARRFTGEIVSADSIQVYTYLDKGSAKASAEERSLVRHHMIDVRYPDESFSGGDYVREARGAIEDTLRRGKTPFIVGGTGLYMRLLVGGIVEVPEADPHLRAALRREEERDPGILHKGLAKVDPTTAAKTDPQNTVRIIRALEVFHRSGIPLSCLQQRHGFADAPFVALRLCLAPDRKLLYERIDKRVDLMIKDGLVDEVFNLYSLGYARHLKPLQSLGYRHIGMFLAGEVSLADATERMKRDTRRFAKRQMTWFRSEPDVIWLDPEDTKGIGLRVARFLGR